MLLLAVLSWKLHTNRGQALPLATCQPCYPAPLRGASPLAVVITTTDASTEHGSAWLVTSKGFVASRRLSVLRVSTQGSGRPTSSAQCSQAATNFERRPVTNDADVHCCCAALIARCSQKVCLRALCRTERGDTTQLFLCSSVPRHLTIYLLPDTSRV